MQAATGKAAAGTAGAAAGAGKAAAGKDEKQVAIKPYDTARNLIMSNLAVIQQACGKAVSAEKLARMLLTDMIRNPQLADCTKSSIMGFMLQTAQLGLETGPLGLVYPIPFKNRKAGGRLEIQLIVGYKGLLALCRRSDQLSTVTAQAVHENDTFEYQYGTEQSLVHKPAKTNRGKVIFYYAMLKLKDGGYQFEVMSYEDIMQHKQKFSKAAGEGPWIDNEPEMCKKTVLRKVCKLAPMSTEVALAVALDEQAEDQVAQNLGAMDSIPAEYREVPSVEEETEARELKDIQNRMAEGAAETAKAAEPTGTRTDAEPKSEGQSAPAEPAASSEFQEEAPAQQEPAEMHPPDDARWRRCVEYLDATVDRRRVKDAVKKQMGWETMKLGKVTGEARVHFMLTCEDLAKAQTVELYWPE